jgi:hypothetical protein
MERVTAMARGWDYPNLAIAILANTFRDVECRLTADFMQN